MSDQLLTIKDVAERLNISERTAYRLIEEGDIPCKRVGTGRGTIRVRPAALEAYINQPSREVLAVAAPAAGSLYD